MPSTARGLPTMLAADQVVAGGVYDCLSASLIESAGYPALAISGAGVAASASGVPDLGLLSFGELLHSARNIIAASSTPVIVDADTGFGNELNVIRTCEQLASAGAAAIVIEDQVMPKRCGHLAGKDVVPGAEFGSKLRAARRALSGTDVMLIARTDALAVLGINEAIARCQMALDCGVDVTFVEAPPTIAAIEEVAARVPGHKMFNIAAGGQTPAVDMGDLAALGYNLIVLPGLALMPAIRGIRDAAAAVLTQRSETPLRQYGIAPRTIFESVGLERWLTYESDFASLE